MKWDKIVKLMGDQPRGWSFLPGSRRPAGMWGNEVDCSITMPQNG